MSRPLTAPDYPELRAALSDTRRYFGYAALFSAAVNLLMLVPILYMLQVYDRVITSGSLPTLGMLTLLMVGLLAALGVFEWVRSMIMVAASNRIELNLRRRVSNAVLARALSSNGRGSAQPLVDLTQLRQYLTSQGMFAFFDTPWVPIYLALMFMFHVWFGAAALIAVVVMLLLAYATERSTNDDLQQANSLNSDSLNALNGTLRNAEAVSAMGMASALEGRHDTRANDVIDLQTRASQRAGALGSISKSFRMIMQSAVLGLGALLALEQQISPGMMIAGALLLGRTLAPIDALVASWKGFSVARVQYDRLGELLSEQAATGEMMQLPRPEGRWSAEQIVVVPPGSKIPTVRGVDVDLEPGESLGIVGPSAAGKSTLARAMLGVWPIAAGAVRIDGASIDQWDRNDLGPFIGYLPQDIELFAGTVADNISRFAGVNADAVVEAARLVGAHDLILHLADGYDTEIGPSGAGLSGGQRQAIALARAVYRQPPYILLDEPSTNLDDQGEKELAESIRRLTQTGSTLILITHRLPLLQSIDKLLLLSEGKVVQQGPRDEVLRRLATGNSGPRVAELGEQKA